jgi:hypothetical protein
MTFWRRSSCCRCSVPRPKRFPQRSSLTLPDLRQQKSIPVWVNAAVGKTVTVGFVGDMRSAVAAQGSYPVDTVDDFGWARVFIPTETTLFKSFHTPKSMFLNHPYRSFLRSLTAVCLLATALTCFAQQPAKTYVVKDGACPWFDRVDKWALSGVPESLLGTTPVSQQSCTDRSLVLTGTPTAIVLAVYDKDLAKFKAAYPAATPTGEKLAVKNPAGGILAYTVLSWVNPPQKIKPEPPLGSGLILLKVSDTGAPAQTSATAVSVVPAVASAAVPPPTGSGAQLKPRQDVVLNGKTEKTYVVKDGAFPWFDRVDKWALSGVPESLLGTTPVSQQSCSDRSLVLTGTPTAIVLAVYDKDLAKFLAAYPAATPTGEKLAVKNPAGGILAYTVLSLVNPPQKIKTEPPLGGGLILLKMSELGVPDQPTATAVPAVPAVPTTAVPPAPAAGAQREPRQAFVLPVQQHVDLYLLMGQSNMVGRDPAGLEAQAIDPRIGFLDSNGRWWIAREPMHSGGSGIGPGISFASAMLATADPASVIGLVPCAVGGSPLSRWVKGGDLYQAAVSRAKTSAAAGQLKAILWHQGESDSQNAADAQTYEVRLTQMFQDIRADLGQPDLPIVVGQLGEFVKTRYIDMVRSALTHLPANLPRVGFADSNGLGHKGDSLHFSAEAEQEMGRRYAAALKAIP